MSVSRYDMKAFERMIYENGFPSYELDVDTIPDKEGMWVLHDSYDHLRKEFANYHDLVVQFLNHLEDQLDDDNYNKLNVELWNKVSTSHIETWHVKELING